MTSVVAGRHVGAVDQHEPAAHGFDEVENMSAQRLSDQWKEAPIDSGHGRLTDSEQVAGSHLVQVLPDHDEGQYDHAVQAQGRWSSTLVLGLDDLQDACHEFLGLVRRKPRCRRVPQQPHLANRVLSEETTFWSGLLSYIRVIVACE
ncbi:MAG TPA: hypothetical protein VKP69_35045 [Isosphaeraceae bacterium]|nr:hypothetical protein [Isosphaeraceae bacterium]